MSPAKAIEEFKNNNIDVQFKGGSTYIKVNLTLTDLRSMALFLTYLSPIFWKMKRSSSEEDDLTKLYENKTNSG